MPFRRSKKIERLDQSKIGKDEERKQEKSKKEKKSKQERHNTIEEDERKWKRSQIFFFVLALLSKGLTRCSWKTNCTLKGGGDLLGNAYFCV